VVYAINRTSSPVRWLPIATCGIRKLMSGEVLRAKISPEVSADSGRRCSAERASDLLGCRVDQADGHPLASLFYRQLQVRVVGDDQHGVDSPEEHVQEQVRCHVDIAALLFSVRASLFRHRLGP